MKKLYVLAIVIASLIVWMGTSTAHASENDYQTAWCDAQLGTVDVILSDLTSVDCVTEDYAVAVDYADNWLVAIEDSLHDASHTGKRAAILLIVGPHDVRSAINLMKNIRKNELEIDVFQVYK